MRKTSHRHAQPRAQSIALVIAAFAVAMVAAPAHSAKPSLQKFQGNYYGCVTSSGVDVPVETGLVFDGKELTGGFIYIEENQRIVGALKLIRQRGDDTLLLQWDDKYGTGRAQLTFSPDTASFAGVWVDEHGSLEEPEGQWNGFRKANGSLKSLQCESDKA